MIVLAVNERRSPAASRSGQSGSSPGGVGLVEEGVLRRVEYQPSPARHEYRLTKKGRDAYPILAAMAAWGDDWLTGPEGTPLVLHHTACDHDMDAVLVCSECDKPLDVDEVRARLGPGVPPAPRSARHDHRRHMRRGRGPTDLTRRRRARQQTRSRTGGSAGVNSVKR
jgi:HxlR-like helix-turn-helix